jgi:hypothetical protein
MKERLLAAIRIETTGEEEFFFDPEEHRYFLGRRELPSVTTILDVAFPWEGPADDFYRNRGTAVHLACELDDLGDLDEATLDPTLRPYLEAWRAFRKRTGFVPDPDGIERRLYHPGKGIEYAGTIDRIGLLPSGRRIIIDIKTGSRYPWHRLQLAAYVNLVSYQDSNPGDYQRGSVTLDRDGCFSFNEFSREEYPVDLAVFRSCQNLYNFKLKHKLI